jgi:hypothetical protein
MYFQANRQLDTTTIAAEMVLAMLSWKYIDWL